MKTKLKNVVNMPVEELKKQVGHRLREIRMEKGFSQIQLAELLRLSHSTIAKYETGVIFPSLGSLIVFSEYFDVSLDYIVGIRNKK